jgi:glycosyltransferase involved in cell wall biosynthesis
MRNKQNSPTPADTNTIKKDALACQHKVYSPVSVMPKQKNPDIEKTKDVSEVLLITSYPPRVCGIATYSEDLLKAIKTKFGTSISMSVCALETEEHIENYPEEVKYTLNTSDNGDYATIFEAINKSSRIKAVVIQHEFGFFMHQEETFKRFLLSITKPIVIVFHTVTSNPDEKHKNYVKSLTDICNSVVVLTKTSAQILMRDYEILPQKITVIAHGTHLVPHLNKQLLKTKYGFGTRPILTTFGLLSSGKSIETTLAALSAIVKNSPDVLFLVIGKTHPEVIKKEKEQYRESLEKKVVQASLENHVKFINTYLPLPMLLEYLQLTDIYIFSTNDPNQAVSGTFAYAMSCGCPIISTPIPHAIEVITGDNGIIFEFCNSKQLSKSVTSLLSDNDLRTNISTNTLQKSVSWAWENSAIKHVLLFEKISNGKMEVKYSVPEINLNHIQLMTTDFGIIQFSKINQPDIESGYTLDDNARALIAMCMHYKLLGDTKSLHNIRLYLNFIKYCQQPEGFFFNYVDKHRKFTTQNQAVNLDDSNGRAIWALGYLISLTGILPDDIVLEAEKIFKTSLLRIKSVHSTRAMAFVIKGIQFQQKVSHSTESLSLLKTFADRLVQMYKHESREKWEWFEGYLTYANSILPEAMLYAWQQTKDPVYKDIAISSFHFLLSQIFNKNGIEVVSNKQWLQKGQVAGHFGEQPIDVAYTLITLGEFYTEFGSEEYKDKMEMAFNWFLGKNRNNQIVYNPCTGGCHDGLEELQVNLNQGAESSISYLLARLTMDEFNAGLNQLKTKQQKKLEKTVPRDLLTYSMNYSPLPDDLR